MIHTTSSMMDQHHFTIHRTKNSVIPILPFSEVPVCHEGHPNVTCHFWHLYAFLTESDDACLLGTSLFAQKLVCLKIEDALTVCLVHCAQAELLAVTHKPGGGPLQVGSPHVPTWWWSAGVLRPTLFFSILLLSSSFFMLCRLTFRLFPLPLSLSCEVCSFFLLCIFFSLMLQHQLVGTLCFCKQLLCSVLLTLGFFGTATVNVEEWRERKAARVFELARYAISKLSLTIDDGIASIDVQGPCFWVFSSAFSIILWCE